MDDQQTYLLNGLLARNFDLGRIVRFRRVQRGRQAESFEVFTAQEQEYLVQIYPQTHEPEQLDFVARTVNTIDGQRFSVVPFLPARNGSFTAEGPQGSRMLVSLAPAGSALPAAQYTEHDVSQVGLRLAWMHRLLIEQLGAAATAPSVPGEISQYEPLRSLMRLEVPLGWVHGDIQTGGLLHDADHQLRVVTDWGLLHWGCPLEDLVDAFLELAVNARGQFDVARGGALLESYHSLAPIRRIPWTPVVARWCAQRLADAASGRRAFSAHLKVEVLATPERLAMAMAGCLR